tara:strand:+ start:54 stop:365 length:312 start_codon:yes stop_codon:yes gene_type:complete
MTKEQETEINLLLATMRCFNEQLYNIKGTHSKILKMKFNRLLKISNQYEREVLRWTKNDKQLEAMYDTLMDVLITVKTEIVKHNDQIQQNENSGAQNRRPQTS